MANRAPTKDYNLESTRSAQFLPTSVGLKGLRGLYGSMLARRRTEVFDHVLCFSLTASSMPSLLDSFEESMDGHHAKKQDSEPSRFSEASQGCLFLLPAMPSPVNRTISVTSPPVLCSTDAIWTPRRVRVLVLGGSGLRPLCPIISRVCDIRSLRDCQCPWIAIHGLWFQWSTRGRHLRVREEERVSHPPSPFLQVVRDRRLHNDFRKEAFWRLVSWPLVATLNGVLFTSASVRQVFHTAIRRHGVFLRFWGCLSVSASRGARLDPSRSWWIFCLSWRVRQSAA